MAAAAADAVPQAGTSFVGRAQELADVARALRSSRIVTLLGPGGSGKTRLAAEATRRRRGGNGVFVELASREDDVHRAIAHAVGAPDPQDGDHLAAAVRTLGASRVLVVLDN